MAQRDNPRMDRRRRADGSWQNMPPAGNQPPMGGQPQGSLADAIQAIMGNVGANPNIAPPPVAPQPPPPGGIGPIPGGIFGGAQNMLPPQGMQPLPRPTFPRFAPQSQMPGWLAGIFKGM